MTGPITKVRKRRPMALDRAPVDSMADPDLVNERGQNNITMDCGMGSAGRRLLLRRNQEIDRELQRRKTLDETALRREPRVFDDRFARVPVGTMVTRSAHWHVYHPSWPAQYGVVVEREVHQERGARVTYPLVWWEGAAAPSTTHPDNAVIANTAWLQARR